MKRNVVWSSVISGLLVTTFCLGLPQFHYTVAIMIALIVRYKDEPYNEPLVKLNFSPQHRTVVE